VKMKEKMVVAALAALMGYVVSAANEVDLAAFREARFGMFIHWGLYSQLGGRWKGEKMDYIGEWIQSRYQIPNAEYAKLARDFNPVRFDADEWVRQAKDAGMEYLVFTTKHHEGFSMYATKASDYNIVDATPFKRDVFGELVAACRRHGLKVGLYYSQNLDWHEFDAGDPQPRKSSRPGALAIKGMEWGNCWDWPDASGKNLERYLKAKVYPQLKELLTKYGEIFVIWFDCPQGMTRRQSQELKDYVRSFQPQVLVSSRIGNDLGDFGSLGDNQMLTGKSDFPLESPMTLNDTWGFKYDDHHWKTGYQVACSLMQAISCNANLILNIGPRPDGRFPDASSDVLAELAAWRKRTGLAFRGAKPNPFPQALPWGWCTVADGNVLQFVVRSDWTNDLEVCGIRNPIKACSAPFERNGETLQVRLPKPDDAMPRVVRVELEGAPDIDQRLTLQNGEAVLIPVSGGKVSQGKSRGSELKDGGVCRISERGSLNNWYHPDDSVSWKVCFPEAGVYRVWLRTETWAHRRPWVGERTVEVSVGEERRTVDLRKDRPLPHTVYELAESDVGSVEIVRPGEYEVAVRNLRASDNAVYQDLAMLRLVRESNVPSVKEPVFLFRGKDRDQYAVQGARSFVQDDKGIPKFSWGKGAKDVRLWYFSRWGLKPFFGPREMRLKTSGSMSGTAVLKVRRLGEKKDRTYEAPWRETTVFQTDLPSHERYEFVDVVFWPDPACEGSAAVTGLVAYIDQSDAETLRLDVDTGTAYHALVGNRRPTFLLSNPGDRTVTWKGAIALRDFFGRGFDVPVDVTAKPKETVRLPLGRDVPWKGYWSAIAEVRAADGSVASAKTTFSRLDEHRVTPVLDYGNFRIGTICHIEGYAPYDREVCYDALVAMGAKMVRCNLCMMGLMQPDGPDQFRTDLQDDVLGKFEEHGMAVDTLLTWAPRWSFSEAHKKICDSGVGIGPITPEPEPFAAFCEKLAHRYGTRIAYYETSNEVELRKPECGTTEELIACQKVAYEAIKRVCPAAKVLTPGFGPFGTTGPQVRVRNCQEDLCDKARDYYDVHAVHAHGGFLWFADNLKNVFMKWRRERGVIDKPWFPNETALGTARGQESDAAEAVWKKVLLCRANGAVDYCWYNLRAKGWDDNDGETSYGMLTADYHPRMTYPAFSALAAVMGGFLETHRFASVNDRFVFRLRPQSDVDTLVVAGWDESALEKPWDLSVRTDARRAFLVDLMGNAEETAVRDGKVALPLNRRPRALRLEGATFADADEDALRSPPPPAKPTALIPRTDLSKRRNRPDFVLREHRQVKELYEANPLYQHRYWQGEKDLSVRAWFDIGKNTTVFRQPNSLQVVLEVSDDVERLADGAKGAQGDSAELEFRFPSQNGGWKLVVARTADGAPTVRVLSAPPGFAAHAAAEKVQVDIARSDGLTRYDVRLPFSDFAISPESDTVSGFRFNFRVNDDDGEGHDGWIELKPANVKAGEYDRYPLVVFEGKWKVK